MEDVLSRLAKARTFSVWDVKSGFWHAVLNDESSYLTTFSTPLGCYCWMRLPFELSPAHEIFQMKLDETIQGMTGVKWIVDDLRIWGEGETSEEAIWIMTPTWMRS